MGLFNRIFGTQPGPDGASQRRSAPDQETYALERYRYMLQAAPPEAIEQAHAAALQQLTPDQRRQVLSDLVRAAPPHEQDMLLKTPYDDPAELARLATRAEIRQPGIMERTLGASPGPGFGAGLLGSFAAAFTGSQVADAFFSALGGSVTDFGGSSPGTESLPLDEEDTDIDGLPASDELLAARDFGGNLDS